MFREPGNGALIHLHLIFHFSVPKLPEKNITIVQNSFFVVHVIDAFEKVQRIMRAL